MSGRQEIEFSFLWIVRCRANGVPALVVSIVGSFVAILLVLSSVYTSMTRAEVSGPPPAFEVMHQPGKEEAPPATPEVFRKSELPPRKVQRKKDALSKDWWSHCWLCDGRWGLFELER